MSASVETTLSLDRTVFHKLSNGETVWVSLVVGVEGGVRVAIVCHCGVPMAAKESSDSYFVWSCPNCDR